MAICTLIVFNDSLQNASTYAERVAMQVAWHITNPLSTGNGNEPRNQPN
jgi:hypothetical protein